jgi:hypothetical protein
MKHLFLLFTLLFSTVASQRMYAQEFTIGALKYSVSEDTCRVFAASTDISGAVVIPSSVTYDGKTYTVTVIGEEAFEDCVNLTSVSIPESVTEIEDSAFNCCYNLTSPTLPKALRTIGRAAFFKCFCITSLTIPNSVTEIGGAAFVACNFTSVMIPNLVTKIDHSTFLSCTRLISVTIPNSVTEIEDSAFSYCFYLPSLTIPSSVTRIGMWAFHECERLKDVTVSWDTPLQIHERAFEFTDSLLSNVTLHVPAGTEALYQAAPVWKDFKWATSVGKETVKQTALYARATDGVLHISGLHSGEAFLIYSINGQLIYKGIARTGEEEVTLPADGVYILAAGEERIKFLSL